MKAIFNKDFFLYGGVTKEEFDSIKEERDLFNYRAWRVVSTFATVYFFILFITTFSFEIVERNSFADIVLSFICLITTILFFTVVKPGNVLLMPTVYITASALLMFGVTLGTMTNTEFLAVTFHVLLLAITLITVDRPYIMGILEFVAVVAFVVIDLFYKYGDTLKLDIYNAISFFVLAQFVNYYMVSFKMKNFLMEKQIERSSFFDDLTGLYNRHAYETDLLIYPSLPPEEDFVYVTMDINGLKKVNDTLGHTAGDEMIVGAAECMKRCIGNYGKMYRLGGDEFSAIIFTSGMQLTHALQDLDLSLLEWEGSIINTISASVGYVTKKEFPNMTVRDMARIADERMYEKKMNYYKSKGIDRRG